MPSENKLLEEKKPKRTHSDKELLKFLWSFVTPYSKMLVFLSFLLLCNVAFVIVGPIFFQKALDYIQRADVLNPTLKMILPPLIAYFIFSIMSWLAYTTQRMFSAKFNVRITNDLRIHIFNEIIQNNLTFFHHSESGKLTSRITNDIQEMNDTGDRFMRIFTNLIRLVVIIIILLIYSVPLTLSAFIFLPLVFLISFLLRKYLRKYERKWRKNFASVNQQFSESMRSIAICKSFAREDTNIQKIKKLNEKTYRSSIKRAFGIFIMGPIGDFFRHLLLIIILTVGVIILNKPNSSLTVAGLYLFIFLLDYFYFPVLGLARNLNRFQGLFAILERLLQISETSEYKEQDFGSINANSIKGDLEFKNVSFSYSKDVPILKDISFKIKPGQRIALVGNTGAGKTTIASIILRFYEINKGEILIDGKDIKDYSLESLRKSIGLVSQKVLLIKGTIRENLLIANPDISDQEMWDALDAVQAREFIELLPDGLDSKVSENGKNLSAGQRQMISFARTLLSNPQLIILDEATSAVDLYTEAKIQNSTDLLLKGKSSIVIAHRLTTILNSDIILVLEDGKVKEIGSHEELIAQNGSYKEMYELYFRTQSAKYLEIIKTTK